MMLSWRALQIHLAWEEDKPLLGGQGRITAAGFVLKWIQDTFVSQTDKLVCPTPHVLAVNLCPTASCSPCSNSVKVRVNSHPLQIQKSVFSYLLHISTHHIRITQSDAVSLRLFNYPMGFHMSLSIILVRSKGCCTHRMVISSTSHFQQIRLEVRLSRESWFNISNSSNLELSLYLKMLRTHRWVSILISLEVEKEMPFQASEKTHPSWAFIFLHRLFFLLSICFLLILIGKIRKQASN